VTAATDPWPSIRFPLPIIILGCLTDFSDWLVERHGSKPHQKARGSEERRSPNHRNGRAASQRQRLMLNTASMGIFLDCYLNF
jgi:hypothetical protein